MWDEGAADRWLAVFRREESLVGRLMDLLRSDQRAMARSCVEELEENLRSKEELLAEIRVLEETKRDLAVSSGIAIEQDGDLAAAVLPHFPPSRESLAAECLGRLGSLREALAELNESTRQMMAHGLWVVRSILGILYGSAGPRHYGGSGGLEGGARTGCFVTRDA